MLFQEEAKFPVTVQLVSLLVLAHYSSFVLFLYSHSLFWAAFILAAWLGGFTLVYTPGVPYK